MIGLLAIALLSPTQIQVGEQTIVCEAVSFLPGEGASASVVCENAPAADYDALRQLNRSFAQNDVTFDVAGAEGTPGEAVALQACQLSILQPHMINGQRAARFAQFDCAG